MSATAYCSTCNKVIAGAPSTDEAPCCPSCGQSLILVPPTVTQLPREEDSPPAAESSARNKGPLPGTIDEPKGQATVDVPPAELPVQIGRFVVRQHLGEGAFGVVYRAYDPQLDCEVALKVARPGTLTTPERVERFLREAKAAAQLRHPNIVPLFETGRDGDLYYLACAFIDGQPLTAIIKEDKTDFCRAARITRRLAEALAYAHGQGVIHRDVKPANVMVDGKGEPLVLDFGLAARHDAEERLTQEGAILGTPLYMAPEQWAGKAVAASDQYSLGCTLFELLAGRAPFLSSLQQLMADHQHSEPPSPRKLKRQVPRDLETICLKCLAKAPAKRYADCQALADDLRRWEEGMPIQARRLSYRERLVRWTRRNPALAAALSSAAVLLVLATVFGFRQWHLNTELTIAIEQGENRFRMAQYSKSFDRALVLCQMGDIARARAILDDLPSDLQSCERDYLEVLCRRKCQELIGHLDVVNQVTFSPDGRHVVSSSADGTAKVWDVATEQDIFTLRGHTGKLTGGAFSPDGKHIVTAGEDGTVRSWNAVTGRAVHVLKGHEGSALSVVTSPDSKYAVSGGADQTVRVWDLTTGKQVRLLRGHTGPVAGVAFSADGQRIASASADKTVRLWDAGTGEEVFCFRGHDAAVRGVALPSKGARAISYDAKAILVWDTATGQVVRKAQEPNMEVNQVSANPNGDRLAVVEVKQRLDIKAIRLWDVNTGDKITPFFNPLSDGTAISFSPDGQNVGLGTATGTVEIWSLNTEQTARAWRDPDGQPDDLAFSPDGKLIATCLDRTVAVREIATGKIMHTFTYPDYPGRNNNPHLPDVTKAAFHARGDRLISSYMWSLREWDLATGNEILWLKLDPSGYVPDNIGHIYSVGLSRDGQLLATGCHEDVVIWDTSSREQLMQLKGHTDPVFSVAFSPDRRLLATASWDRTVRVWDLEKRKQVHLLTGHSNPVRSVIFHPDGNRIISGSSLRDSEIKVWSAVTGKGLLSLKAHDWLVGLAISTDGKRIISTGFSATEGGFRTPVANADLNRIGQLFGTSRSLEVKVWDIITGQEILSLSHGADNELPPRCLALSSDGKHLVCGKWHSTFVVWDLSGLVEARTLRGHSEPVSTVSFTRAGDRLVTSDVHGKEAVVWEVQTGRKLLALHRPEGDLCSVQFHPDGKSLVSAGGEKIEGCVRWDAKTGARLRTYTSPNEARFSWTAVSPDGQWIAAVSRYHQQLVLWKAITGEQWTPNKDRYVSDRIAFTPDSEQLMYSVGGGYFLYDVRTRTQSELRMSELMAFGPEGRWLTVDHRWWPKRMFTIRVEQAGKEIASLERAPIRVYHPWDFRASFSPDGKYVVGALDKTLVVWDAATGRKLRTLQAHTRDIKCITFSPDGLYVATGSDDRTVKLWETARILPQPLKK